MMIKLRTFLYLLLISFVYAYPLHAAEQDSNSGWWQTPYLSVVEYTVMALFLAWCVWRIIKRYNRFIDKYDNNAVKYGPEVLTTMGIAGCFGGILISLIFMLIVKFVFPEADSSTNVDSLIVGVSVSFVSSITGVICAYRIRNEQFKDRRITIDIEAPKGATIDDLVLVINSLKKGLIGDEQDTLITQIKLLRTENNDRQTALKSSFDDFAKHMVENNQKAFIEALKEVIRDFNEKITEQFGENFKQLNEAVGKLLIWQKQYKEELDQLLTHQKEAADAFTSAANDLTKTAEEAEVFIRIAEKFESTLQQLDKRIIMLNDQELELATVLMSMQNVTPEFKSKIDLMLAAFSDGVKDSQSLIRDAVSNMTTKVNEAQFYINREMLETQKRLSSNIEIQVETVNRQMTRGTEVLTTGLTNLDRGLQDQLEKSLTQLGNQLAALSQKFVEDYRPLTDELRRVVQLANDLRNNRS